MNDSIQRGEAPIASHLLYTQPGILDDTDPKQRRLGMDIGVSWGIYSDYVVVYVDLGVTPGMEQAIEYYHGWDIPVIHRAILGELPDKYTRLNAASTYQSILDRASQIDPRVNTTTADEYKISVPAKEIIL